MSAIEWITFAAFLLFAFTVGRYAGRKKVDFDNPELKKIWKAKVMQFHKQQMIEEEREKEKRRKSNAEFEKNQPKHLKLEDARFTNAAGFVLWALITHHYMMERSPSLERQVQAVCIKIGNLLEEHELDVLFQIDREICNEAMEFLIDMDSDVQQGMEQFKAILKKDTPTDRHES